MTDGSTFQLTEVGLAVEDLEQAIPKFEGIFGEKAAPVEEFTDPGIEMRFTWVAIGDQRINLLQPITDSGPVARAIRRRGEGFFNVFMQVSDISAAMKRMSAAGVEFVEPEPRVFPGGTYNGRTYASNPVAWTNPRSFHGLLVEIQEYEWTSAEPDPASDDRIFTRIPELGVAVEDLDAATTKFEAVFGVTAAPVVEAPVPGVEMRFNWVDIGDQRINLYQDLGDSGPIARAIQRGGEGLFNVMLEVQDVEAAAEHMRAGGVKFVEPEPRVLIDGTHGGRSYARHRVMWTHPRSLHGMLIEVQDFDWVAGA